MKIGAVESGGDAVADVERRAEALRASVLELRAALRRVIVGQQSMLDGLLMSLFAGGHTLLEGVPGLGKTLLVKSLGRVTGLESARIQFTPDLMPADILGTQTLLETPEGPTVAFKPGPIFAELVLADEINRANPRTQAALLEAMAERQVTHGSETRRLGPPFFVMATENPIDQEGTYPLPEAQTDRFLIKLEVPLPGPDDLMDILDVDPVAGLESLSVVVDKQALLGFQDHVRQVPVAERVKRVVVDLVLGTRPERVPQRHRPFVRLGASPRGAQAVLACARARAAMAGRFQVSEEDVRAVAIPTLSHRVLLNFAARAEGVTAREVVEAVLATSG
jgi:MoxR-like ATPase